MTIRNVCSMLLCLVIVGVARPSITSAQSQTRYTDKQGITRTHQDHSPKHGGTFFMAMDYRHHVEGVLLPPCVFRVYLYDSHTKPLDAARMKQASGVVRIGDAENAPQVPLRLAKDGLTLEAELKPVSLPVTLTLLLRLPGMAAGAKPELFTFPFSRFVGDKTAPLASHSHHP